MDKTYVSVDVKVQSPSKCRQLCRQSLRYVSHSAHATHVGAVRQQWRAAPTLRRLDVYRRDSVGNCRDSCCLTFQSSKCRILIDCVLIFGLLASLAWAIAVSHSQCFANHQLRGAVLNASETTANLTTEQSLKTPTEAATPVKLTQPEVGSSPIPPTIVWMTFPPGMQYSDDDELPDPDIGQ